MVTMWFNDVVFALVHTFYFKVKCKEQHVEGEFLPKLRHN